MRREDRQLLTELAQVNTALPAFAQRVMGNTATPTEHSAVADRVIALGQAIRQRADNLTIINPDPGNSTDGTSLAATLALSAIIDMTDALDRHRLTDPASQRHLPDTRLE
jgi:hypothetical protein